MATKKIKGGLITINDKVVEIATDLQVEVSQDQINNASNQNIYLEVDLTKAKAVNIILPEIASLQGQLGFCIWVNDKGKTAAAENSIKITCSGSDTTSGRTSVLLASEGFGVLLSPVGNSAWGAFFTQSKA